MGKALMLMGPKSASLLFGIWNHPGMTPAQSWDCPGCQRDNPGVPALELFLLWLCRLMSAINRELGAANSRWSTPVRSWNLG